MKSFFNEERLIHETIRTIIPQGPKFNCPTHNCFTDQPIRVFFSEDVEYCSSPIVNKVHRLAYGFQAVMISTGIHPENYRIYSFNDFPILRSIIDDITFLLEKNCPSTDIASKVQPNALELKISLGQSINKHREGTKMIYYQTNQGDLDLQNVVWLKRIIKKIVYCHRLGWHVDTRWIRSRGSLQQDNNGTTDGSKCIITCTVASPDTARKLKTRYKNMDTREKHKQIINDVHEPIELVSGSINVLDPQRAEKGIHINGKWFVQQHGADFKADKGISIAMVFRSIQVKEKAIVTVDKKSNLISVGLEQINEAVQKRCEKFQNTTRHVYDYFKENHKEDDTTYKTVQNILTEIYRLKTIP